MTDKPKKVKIRTTYNGSPWITATKIYEATLCEDDAHKGCYTFKGELGSPCYTRLEKSVHLAGQDWEIVK